ncbi:unnamed protein product [Prorocentrum cordatum]|uniref:Secreted protein n=1 Tax=Prorocentrum cordatum TaxID=2364126 RepID=A0ABN9UJJ4_9DINO|nr:unnamed protein product [Polarella glacialis]
MVTFLAVGIGLHACALCGTEGKVYLSFCFVFKRSPRTASGVSEDDGVPSSPKMIMYIMSVSHHSSRFAITAHLGRTRSSVCLASGRAPRWSREQEPPTSAQMSNHGHTSSGGRSSSSSSSYYYYFYVSLCVPPSACFSSPLPFHWAVRPARAQRVGTEVSRSKSGGASARLLASVDLGHPPRA